MTHESFKEKMHNCAKLAGSFLISYSILILGALFLNPDHLLESWMWVKKPPLFLSDVAYQVLWGIQVTGMALALFLVWRRGLHRHDVQVAFSWFVLHLGFLIVWMFLFSYLRNPMFIFFTHAATLITLAIVMNMFYRISKPAAYFLLPMLPIRLFGFYLFVHLIILNPELIG